jgi:hypothetical protein
MEFRVFWDVVLCSHIKVDWCFRDAMMMEAVCTSETSAHFNVTTKCYIPEDIKFILTTMRT